MLGRVCNLSSDWAGVLQGGLLRRRGTGEARDITIDAVIAYADRYEDPELSEAVRYGAKDMKTALNMFRILHMCLWASNVYHNTIVRKADRTNGAATFAGVFLVFQPG